MQNVTKEELREDGYKNNDDYPSMRNFDVLLAIIAMLQFNHVTFSFKSTHQILI